MKFKSRDGKIKRVASTSGHVILIGDEFVNVQPHMEGEAYAAGCLSEEVFNSIADQMRAEAGDEGKTPEPTLVSETPEALDDERMEVVSEKLKVMLDAKNEADFTKEGLPNKVKLNEYCGFRVLPKEFDAAWAVVTGSTTTT